MHKILILNNDFCFDFYIRKLNLFFNLIYVCDGSGGHRRWCWCSGGDGINGVGMCDGGVWWSIFRRCMGGGGGVTWHCWY